MNKLLFILLMLLTINCYAGFSLFSSLYARQDKIENQLNNMTAKLGVIENMQTNLQLSFRTDMQAIVTAAVHNEMKAYANAVVGLGNKIENIDKSIKVQGDMITQKSVQTSIVNDPLTWQLFSGVLSSIILFLLKDSKATKVWLQNMLKSANQKDNKIDTYEKEVITILKRLGGEKV